MVSAFSRFQCSSPWTFRTRFKRIERRRVLYFNSSRRHGHHRRGGKSFARKARVLSSLGKSLWHYDFIARRCCRRDCKNQYLDRACIRRRLHCVESLFRINTHTHTFTFNVYIYKNLEIIKHKYKSWCFKRFSYRQCHLFIFAIWCRSKLHVKVQYFYVSI